MKVIDLIEQICYLPPDLEVFIASDPEGNSFSPSVAMCKEKMDQDNQVYAEEDYEEYKEDLRDVVVIWP